MTSDTVRPSVFDAGLPVVTYLNAHNRDEVHRRIRQARQQAPIALGPYGLHPSERIARVRSPLLRSPQTRRYAAT